MGTFKNLSDASNQIKWKVSVHSNLANSFTLTEFFNFVGLKKMEESRQAQNIDLHWMCWDVKLADKKRLDIYLIVKHWQG